VISSDCDMGPGAAGTLVIMLSTDIVRKELGLAEAHYLADVPLK
jgi:hypothetical protein